MSSEHTGEVAQGLLAKERGAEGGREEERMGLRGKEGWRECVWGAADSLSGHRFGGNQRAQPYVPRGFLLDSHPPTCSRRLASAISL